MSVEVKKVSPNGSPRAIMATHDRAFGGREFQLFTTLVQTASAMAIPTGEETTSGHQKVRLFTTEEIIYRCSEISRMAIREASRQGWLVEGMSVEDMYDDADARSKAGF